MLSSRNSPSHHISKKRGFDPECWKQRRMCGHHLALSFLKHKQIQTHLTHTHPVSCRGAAAMEKQYGEILEMGRVFQQSGWLSQQHEGRNALTLARVTWGDWEHGCLLSKEQPDSQKQPRSPWIQSSPQRYKRLQFPFLKLAHKQSIVSCLDWYFL